MNQQNMQQRTDTFQQHMARLNDNLEQNMQQLNNIMVGAGYSPQNTTINIPQIGSMIPQFLQPFPLVNSNPNQMQYTSRTISYPYPVQIPSFNTGGQQVPNTIQMGYPYYNTPQLNPTSTTTSQHQQVKMSHHYPPAVAGSSKGSTVPASAPTRVTVPAPKKGPGPASSKVPGPIKVLAPIKGPGTTGLKGQRPGPAFSKVPGSRVKGPSSRVKRPGPASSKIPGPASSKVKGPGPASKVKGPSSRVKSSGPASKVKGPSSRANCPGPASSKVPGPPALTRVDKKKVPAAAATETRPNNLNNDCKYFFGPDGCAMGGDCEYRHSEAAKGSWKMCRAWASGECEDWALCHRRHMDQKKLYRQKREFISNLNDKGAKVQNSGKRAKMEAVTERDDDEDSFDEEEESEGDEDADQEDKKKEAEVPQRRSECPVCFGSVAEDKDLQFCAFIECGHITCEACASDLLKKKPALCPLCRCEVVKRPLNIFL